MIDDDPDLSCYYCDGVTRCKPNCNEYRAWQDVIDSEDIYAEVVLGDGKDAFNFKVLPTGICYIAESNGLVCVMWKNKEDSSSVFMPYFNNRDRNGRFHNNIKNNTV